MLQLQRFMALAFCFSAVVGCQKQTPVPLATPAKPALYRVIAVSLAGSAAIEAEYGLRIEAGGPMQRRVATTYTKGTVASGDKPVHFDSSVPSSADPWPMLMQHAVSATPGLFKFDSSGSPTELLDADKWLQAALAALQSLELSGRPDFSDSPMLNTDAVVHDLRSIFPGTPVDGALMRAVTIAGLQVLVTETCTVEETASQSTWTCQGELDSIGGSRARVFDVATSATLVFSRLGMERMESEFVGTSVALNPTTGDLIDQPIAGRRLVERR